VLAAGEILLSKGKLSVEERKTIADKYGKISAVARKEFQKRATEQTIKEAGRTQFATYDELLKAAEASGKPEDRRKFLEAAMRGEAGNKLKLSGKELNDLANLMDNDEDKRAFFESVTKSGRNKVAAIETMANMELIRDRNGKVVRTDQALADRADSFTPDDLLDADEYYVRSGNAVPEAVQDKIKSTLQETKKFGQMIKNVSSPEQQIRILNQYADVKRASAQAKADVKILRQKDRKYSERITQLRRKQRRERDPARKAKLGKLIDSTAEHQETLKSQIQDAQKNVTKP
jgi:hypothetical protein